MPKLLPSFLKNIEQAYSRFFSLQEIEKERRSYLFWWGILALIIFDLRSLSSTHENFDFVDSCWVYFQNCGDFWPFKGLPSSYDFNIFLSALGTLICVNIYFLAYKKWALAHLTTLSLMVIKFLAHFVLKDTGWQNFEYFMQVPTFIFLLCPHKMKSVRLCWCLLLLLAAQVKFHEAWAAGAYFTSLELGLPIFSSFLSREFIPLISNSVIFLEIWGAFGLLAKSPTLRKVSFTLWVIFHLYSITLVQFHYPVRCLMVLLIAFGGIWHEKDSAWNPYQSLKSRPLKIRRFAVVKVFKEKFVC
jgi:hypothetical protein